MAHAIPSSALTPADRLRWLLDASERRAVTIRGAGAGAAQELLHWLDEIDALLPALAAAGVDLAPEQGRWQAVQGAVRRHSRALRQELAAGGGLPALRAGLPAPPPAARWWWRLDDLARQRRRRALTRGLAALAVLLLLLFGGGWLFNRLFPVDPAVAESFRLRTEGERALRAGDLAAAIAHYEAARAAAATGSVEPLADDVDALAWLAVLYELTGEEEAATAAAADLAIYLPPAAALAMRSSIFSTLGHGDRALALAEAAIAADPASTQAYLSLGSAHELQGELAQAIAAYEQAAAAAAAAGEDTLQAIARVRLAYLLQRGASGSLDPAGTTPTP